MASKRFVSKFSARDIASVYASHQRNPSVSGSVPSDVRNIQAAGSDAGKKYKLSGSVQAPGMVYHRTTRQAVERTMCSCERHTHDPETCK